MRFNLDRESFLKPLQTVQGVVERRQTLPILTNVLLVCDESRLWVTATDMELELVAQVGLEKAQAGEITVPARKLVDICRALPSGASIDFSVDGDRVVLKSGRSRYTLSTLPAAEYPSTDALSEETRIAFKQGAFKRLLELSHFAMAQQDVRYYLNGLLLEISEHEVRAVATDGHRLAIAEMAVEGGPSGEPTSLILPRKGVLELIRLMGTGDEAAELCIAGNAVQLSLEDVRFTSKLIDGRFPDYMRVIPDAEKCDKQISVDRDELRQCLVRAAILSNDKYRAVRLCLEPGVLRIVANNPEQEEAEDELEVAYEGEALEIGFNVSYLVEALGALPADTARIFLTDSASSCLIEPEGSDAACRFVVMPMRL